ncbi:hypothetical protein [Cellvibrio sp. NN19]|uniref:hypothetical protein n=1 Tax=Cellvibrio chitinivorans TaxID=3102792 RepID=UPI002B4134C3|nr:hypothetical protein [Cellvibrio sp. NN19]
MSNVAASPRHAEPKLLPVVRRVIEQLNLLFIDHFGVLGKGLVDDVFKQWLLAGKTGPSGLRRYVSALGMQLQDARVRDDFTERADRLLLHLQSGYVS